MPPINPAALENDLLLRGVWEGLGRPESHATGGYVRDRLLGRGSVDLDLALAGDLDEVRGPARRLAARLDTRAHVLGSGSKRVWRIEAPEIRVELWPLADLSLDDDIRRRDFSCNALVWKLPDGPLVDRVGGLEDLGSHTLRAISKANLEDDPVRLVRAPRFLSQLEGFELDPESAGWIGALAPRLADAPRERIGQELLRLLIAPGAEIGLRALLDLGLLVPAAPAGATPDPAWLEVNLIAAARLAGAAPHPLSAAVLEAGRAGSLALLLRAWGAPTAHVAAPYAWPRSERRHAARAAMELERAVATAAAPAAARRAFIHRTGAAFPAVIALAAAVVPDRPWRRWWRLWRARAHELVDPTPLLAGPAVATLLGLEEGPELGAAMRVLIEAQVRGKVRTADGARRWLERECSDVVLVGGANHDLS